jgi:folate-binding protein YgfZ
MIELIHLAAIRFSDTDAGNFLHGQLSADVLSLENGSSTFACYCEPKGRVLALMLVQKVNDAYLVIMSSTLVTSVIERLKIYRMRSRVKIENLEDHAIWGLPESGALERAVNNADAVQIPNCEEKILVTPRESANAPGLGSQKDWKFSELTRGLTWLSQETSGEFLPQMLGFEELGAVNYKKGCYPGQEIVARTHYLGKVKRHPRILKCKLEHCPRPMDKIRISDGEQAYDAIVADSESDTDGYICVLAITRMEPGLEAMKIEYLDEVSDVL